MNSEYFEVKSDVYVPIVEYENLLNYVSQTYGVPIHNSARYESAVLTRLSQYYKELLIQTTDKISRGSFESHVDARKNSLSEFQVKYLGLSPYLAQDKGKFSYKAEVRDRINQSEPNFINSLGTYYSNISSNNNISNYMDFLEYVEGEIDNTGNPLYVVRPNYSRKEGATHRLNTDKPNIQSLKKMHRRNFLVPREGYVFVQADISGQDPSIFFNGLCRDEDIIKGFYEVGEYYLPVVSKITGTPMSDVDIGLRNSYKIGILSLMNGKTEKNLAKDMGSLEHAKRLIDFVESNPMYSRFLTSASRELHKPNPTAYSLVGNLTREIKQTGFSGKNQLRNSPIQMTAIALFCISIFELFRQIGQRYEHLSNNSLEEVLKYVRPILHLHDEVLLEVKDENNLPEIVSDSLKWALSIKYEDWAPMKAEPIISERYCL